MAKPEEADPRWIVQDRTDGANVNAWHWEERSLNEKAHEAIKALFKGFALPGGGDLAIKEVSDISGDVTVAQRKGKIMCYFELKMTLKYAGTDAASGDTVDGKITVPDVDHDTFRDEFTMTVASTSSGAAQDRAQKLVSTSGRPAIRKALAEYFEALYIEHSVGRNVKQLQQQGVSAGSTSPASPPNSAARPAAAAAKPAAAASGSSSTSFEQIFVWRAPPQELWLALTDERRASAYTRSPAKIDPRATGAFEFMGGAMSGYFVEVQHPAKLAMQWRLSSWPSGVFSSVVVTLAQEEPGVTRMEFAQVGVPSGELERVTSGWMCNFWDPIKAVFGFSYELK